MSLDQLNQEELQEMSFIEITYEILKERKQPIAFFDLVQEIAKLLGISQEEVDEKISQFYTDLNTDGRFLNVGDNTWGIKGWYTVEQFEDDIVPTTRKKKKNQKQKRNWMTMIISTWMMKTSMKILMKI